MSKASSSDFPSDFRDESKNKEKFVGRLRSKREKAGFTQQDLATKIGVSLTSVQNYEAGRIPRGEHLVALSKALSCSIDWLLTGESFEGEEEGRSGNARLASDAGQMPGLVPEGEPKWMAPGAAPEMGYTLVPYVRARLAAGTGSLETEGEVIGLYAFKTDFLHRKGRAKHMVLMDVVGDSMEPEVKNGDTVLIDESQNEIIAGGLFAVGIEQEVFVKYLDRIPGKLVLRSENPKYTPIEVDMNSHLAEPVRIIGRVVWGCREYVR